MKFMILVKATRDSEAGVMPTDDGLVPSQTFEAESPQARGTSHLPFETVRPAPHRVHDAATEG
jgi:hypothetical protein